MAEIREITTSMLGANEYPDHTHTFIMHHTYGTGEQGGSGIELREIVAVSNDLAKLQEAGHSMYPRPTTWEPDGFRIYINLSTEEGRRLWDINKKESDIRHEAFRKDREEHPENWHSSTVHGITIHMKKSKLFDDNTIYAPDYPKTGLMMPSMCGFIDPITMEYFITKPIDPGTSNGASQETPNS